MELFDVVDKNRNFLGYTKQRGEELNDNEYHVGVEMWLFNNKKLLMTQRSLNKSHPGKWEVPGGGSQTKEKSLDTLKRELKEEVGLSLKEDYELINTVIYKKQFVDMYKSNMLVDLSKVVLQEEEVSDIKFVSQKEFMMMAHKGEIVASVYQRYETIKDKIKEDW